MIPVGGIRARYVKDSLYAMLNTSLRQLGWFDSNRQHLPFTFSTVEVDDQQTIDLNTLVLVDGGITSVEAEMGSQLSDMRRQFFVDFYAENRVLGIQVSNDIKDILEGRMPSIGRSAPTFSVYDYSLATPAVSFYSEIEQVIVDRTHNPSKAWERHWYSISLIAIDSYSSDAD